MTSSSGTKVSPKSVVPGTLEKPISVGPGHRLGQQTVVQMMWSSLHLHHETRTEIWFHGPLVRAVATVAE